MPAYQYIGVDRSGKKVSGAVEASSDGELRMQLRTQGIRPTKLTRVDGGTQVGTLTNLMVKSAATKPTARTRAPLDVVVNFTRQLQVMISAGIPLVQAMEILAEQQLHRGFKSAIIEIGTRIQGGAYLWESFAGYPLLFPKIYVSLIRAGESSGSLDTILKRLTRYLEDAARMRRIIKSAMMYPVFVIVIAIGVISGMLGFVIPKFEEMLKGSGQELPGPTQVVIDFSHFFVDHIFLIIGGTVATGFVLFRFFQTPEGKALRDRLLFQVPLFGSLMQKAGVARFARTMTVLLGSGINLVDGIDICKATIDNVVLEGAVARMKGEVEAGKTLGSVLNSISVFPKMAVQMISVGENTGALDKMLEKVADFYEVEVETTVNGLTKLIEPILLVVLGGTVGGLMVAMYLPIFKMAGGTGGG